MLKKWEDLPEFMKVEEVEPYYRILERKKCSLAAKRIFDIIMAAFLLILFSPLMIFIALLIKFDSPGPAIYKQERVTQYGRKFKVYKFRTMINDADKIGSHVTTNNDSRITKVGEKIRGARIDEFPQLINVLRGDMSFVGTRPEAVKYVESYTKNMRATLLLPAGITSKASIEYKDEAKLLEKADDIDLFYIEKILPEKMRYNLDSIEKFSIIEEVKVLFKTVAAVL
ncbi:glycosyl transferase [Clostridiales bacterium S5-A14a]|nr:glycosyl transferase [Clostridiales bacterium S5-A14a]